MPAHAQSGEPIVLLVRLMSMWRCVVAIVMAGAAACTSSSAHNAPSHQSPTSSTRSAPPTRGTVAGKLLMVGGPSPGIHRGLRGTIVVHARTHSGPVVRTLVAGANGSFRGALPPGH